MTSSIKNKPQISYANFEPSTLSHSFSFLPPIEVGKASLVCKSWHNVVAAKCKVPAQAMAWQNLLKQANKESYQNFNSTISYESNYAEVLETNEQDLIWTVRISKDFFGFDYETYLCFRNLSNPIDQVKILLPKSCQPCGQSEEFMAFSSHNPQNNMIILINKKQRKLVRIWKKLKQLSDQLPHNYTCLFNDEHVILACSNGKIEIYDKNTLSLIEKFSLFPIIKINIDEFQISKDHLFFSCYAGYCWYYFHLKEKTELENPINGRLHVSRDLVFVVIADDMSIAQLNTFPKPKFNKIHLNFLKHGRFISSLVANEKYLLINHKNHLRKDPNYVVYDISKDVPKLILQLANSISSELFLKDDLLISRKDATFQMYHLPSGGAAMEEIDKVTQFVHFADVVDNGKEKRLVAVARSIGCSEESFKIKVVHSSTLPKTFAIPIPKNASQSIALPAAIAPKRVRRAPKCCIALCKLIKNIIDCLKRLFSCKRN